MSVNTAYTLVLFLCVSENTANTVNELVVLQWCFSRRNPPMLGCSIIFPKKHPVLVPVDQFLPFASVLKLQRKYPL